ncbi:rhamnogalacturonan acetylesterase [Roseateles chitosanitabidus]|uniref:rhamnogalacturonan acetylesterase n=1 Tax=Roseateles chitosanitabidus TaxID=65048 RepID=UPI00082BED66|nr:rhamnogalacturonan acetylesterase [Roseateles chitosanitabidus]
MRTRAWLAALALAAGAAQAQQDTARTHVDAARAVSLRVILVGDSTMATKSGYGDALCARFRPEVQCLNLARGGRSTKSYRAEGLWGQVMTLLRDRPAGQVDVVLMQFGHNDQPGKPGRSTDLVTEFPVNLAGYAQDVAQTGASLVMLTPLTRRSFDGNGYLTNDLRPWAETTLRVGHEQQVPVIDLHAVSRDAVQAMGETEADSLAMAPKPASAPAQATSSSERAGAANPAFDRTHLGAKGAQVFSAMVARELAATVPGLGQWMR